MNSVLFFLLFSFCCILLSIIGSRRIHVFKECLDTQSTLLCTELYCCVLRNVLSLLGAGGTYRHSEQTADGNDQRSGEREKESVRKSDRDEERKTGRDRGRE